MFKLPFFRRSTRPRQVAGWLLLLLTIAVILDRAAGPGLGDLPYPIRFFATAEPSSLLLLVLVILLITLIGRPKAPGAILPEGQPPDRPDRLAD